MKENIDRSVWINYLNEFTRRNSTRPTRLEVFGENGAQVQERGLLFAGVSLERGNGAPSIAMMFSARNGDTPPHLTHLIENVQEITPKRGLDGRDEALEIVDSQGEKSLLRFETQPMISANSDREWSWCKSPFDFLSSIKMPPPPPPAHSDRNPVAR